MAEFDGYCGVSEPDTMAMKETLQAQQQLLQKLYVELDQEREASASAASEALAMILRLQGEKAAVKMEACQYKRLAEEKICHAEESLEIFEDLIYQKEMEIASLEYQVQAYKCKLLSFGWSDIVPGDSRFPENLLSQGSDLHKGDFGGSNVRRHSSLPPPVPLKDSNHKKSPSVEKLDFEKKSGHGNFDSYWQQIRDLDEQVKEIAHCNNKSTDLNIDSRSCSANAKSMSIIDSCSSTVQDIFEVPKHKETANNACENSKETGKLCLIDEAENVKTRMLHLNKPISLECYSALVHPTIGVTDSQAKFDQLCKRVERLEGERSGTSQEIGYSGEEERKLLREIHGQLRNIQAEIQSLKESKKVGAKDDQQVHCLKEAMLHFWC